MTRRQRIALFAPALGGFAALLAWSVAGLPRFGSTLHRYGALIDHVAVPERHMTNAVTALVFDYRGFDTMGEEFILFAAVLGVTLLLRQSERGEHERHHDDVRSDLIRIGGILAVGAGVLTGLWLVAFGFVTPGGGFQGGVALASGVVLVYLASDYRSWTDVTGPRVLEPLESVGAGGYVVIGVAALFSGLPFLTNLLGPGDPGTVWSGGSAAFVNWSAGLEVAAANILLFREFLEEYIVPLGASR
ncbi:MAG TPA: hydrogen gas-evolving membrane-bound hydrogenase subunit E [Gaiellaceae bacterium]|nr:hydrogen gas-evolving membrane-bound hydrogenase subunit E [Gaiellaceae bacterium]